MLTRVPRQVVAWGLPLWSRGLPGRPTPPDVFRLIYTAWLVAFALKVLGASWDVSWHFRWLRDDLAPPHLINTVGTMIVVALTIVHWYTGYGVDRAAQRLILWGTGTFLVAIPLDLINHKVNGLDITAWSPSHALLFIGTGVHDRRSDPGVVRRRAAGPAADRRAGGALRLLPGERHLPERAPGVRGHRPRRLDPRRAGGRAVAARRSPADDLGGRST